MFHINGNFSQMSFQITVYIISIIQHKEHYYSLEIAIG